MRSRLWARAGLDALTARFARLGGTPQQLRRAVTETRAVLTEREAGLDG